MEQLARRICEKLMLDPDEIVDMHGPVYNWDVVAAELHPLYNLIQYIKDTCEDEHIV